MKSGYIVPMKYHLKGKESGMLVMILLEMWFLLLIILLLILGVRDTFEINGSFGAPEKRFGINFSETKAKFWLGLRCNGDKSYLLVNGKIFLSSKQITKMSTFQMAFV